MRSILIIIVLLITSGCCKYMPSDVLFLVEGVAPSGDKCELHLLFEGKDMERVETISEDFVVDYYVSFCQRNYIVQAVCNGKIVSKKTVFFPSETTPQPYDIGIIQSKGKRVKNATP